MNGVVVKAELTPRTRSTVRTSSLILFSHFHLITHIVSEYVCFTQHASDGRSEALATLLVSMKARIRRTKTNYILPLICSPRELLPLRGHIP
jgi:hypothetical protein